MEKIKKYWKFISKNRYLIIVFIIFLFEVFLRFYQMDLKNPFGYDQVDNAWAAKNIIINHAYPLVGMVAKANSGIYIGPLYYYFVSIFYWIFNLNPIASWYIAGFTSLLSFLVIFYLTKKLFSVETAIFAIILNTFNFSAIFYFDRVQWPVQLLPLISLIIFYLLYKVITGDIKKIFFLAIAVGIAFNIHFTAIFFPIIILLSLPLFPRNKQTLKYMLLSLVLFIIFIIPNIAYLLINKAASANAIYISTFYHGFHLTRMFQITKDAIIQFDPYLVLDKIKQLKILILPFFFFVYLFKSFTAEKKRFSYLVLLYFIVPWIIFATYSGEISDYYFGINRYIALLILSFLIYRVWKIKFVFVKILVLALICLYGFVNLSNFLPYKDEGNLINKEQIVKKALNEKREIGYAQGVPESYVYYYYYLKLKGVDPYANKK